MTGKRAINLSDLREVVRREQERKWRDDHADFIAACNATIDTEGLRQKWARCRGVS